MQYFIGLRYSLDYGISTPIQLHTVFPFSVILIQMKGGHGYMKTLVGGAIAAILGVIGIVAWFPQFLTVLAGTIPVMLLLGQLMSSYNHDLLSFELILD